MHVLCSNSRGESAVAKSMKKALIEHKPVTKSEKQNKF